MNPMGTPSTGSLPISKGEGPQAKDSLSISILTTVRNSGTWGWVVGGRGCLQCMPCCCTDWIIGQQSLLEGREEAAS